jgi:kumamolisin
LHWKDFDMAQHELAGSDRQPVPGACSVGKAEPAERLEVSVILRHGAADALREKVRKLASHDGSETQVKREDFAQQFGARQEDIDAVGKFAAAHGLAVVEANAARRTVVLSGTVSACNEAFGIDLQQFEHSDGTYRGRTGPLHLPEELKDSVEAVLGLDNRPAARPHFRRRPVHGNVRWHASGGASASFSAAVLASLYGFPAGEGQGETVAIIELGGGYRTADLQAYFAGLGISPAPAVSAVSVDHAMNLATGDANGPDGEVMLDIEVVGAVAPAAKIVVYFAPNTDAGFLDAITTAVHDTTNRPSVISISWGGPECDWTTRCSPPRRWASPFVSPRATTAPATAPPTGRITWTSRRPARTCWHAAAPLCRPPTVRFSTKPRGTTERTPAPAAAGSASSSPCRRGRPD